jgi:hypothetical protein
MFTKDVHHKVNDAFVSIVISKYVRLFLDHSFCFDTKGGFDQLSKLSRLIRPLYPHPSPVQTLRSVLSE